MGRKRRPGYWRDRRRRRKLAPLQAARDAWVAELWAKYEGPMNENDVVDSGARRPTDDTPEDPHAKSYPRRAERRPGSA